MTRTPARINDVAAAAGVSRQTVTRAVNNMSGISADTRDRVLAAARDLQYRPSRFGRGLVNPKTRTLGLLIDDLGNPYYAELASAVLESASATGWSVILTERAHTAVDRFPVDEFTNQVDAVISFVSVGLRSSGNGLPDLPMVEIDSRTPRPTHGQVVLDRKPAIAAAVAHLRQRGARHPVILDQLDPSPRAEGFRRAFDRVGIDSTRIGWATTDLAAGSAAVRHVLDQRPGTDTVVAFDDVMAMGVLRALSVAGVSVPAKMRVLGVDGLEIGRFFSPRLSTLALDLPLVARTALDLVLAMHARRLDGTPDESATEFRRRIEYTLDIGEST